MTPGDSTGAPRKAPGPAERRRTQLEYELDLARQVQRSLFPAPLPQVSGMRLDAENHPARIVSGDLYDVIVIDPERVAIVCADVSGKGFPAALLASELRAYVRATLRAACVFNDASLGPLPLQVVALLNSEISRRSASGRYATMVFAELDASDRSLRYVNAGQNAPLLVVPGADAFAELATGGPPVGLFEDAVYEVGTLKVPDQGTVLMYTDGVVEACNLDEEEFGLARLIEVCAASRDRGTALIAAVMEAVRGWTGASEQDDDITLVTVAAGEARPSMG